MRRAHEHPVDAVQVAEAGIDVLDQVLAVYALNNAKGLLANTPLLDEHWRRLRACASKPFLVAVLTLIHTSHPTDNESYSLRLVVTNLACVERVGNIFSGALIAMDATI